MRKIVLTCRHLLSLRSTTIIILLISVVAKIVLQLSIFSISGDKLIQLVAAQNLLEGNGITISHLGLDNLTAETYTPLMGWPPGYSLAMAPLLWIFGNDYVNAAIFFDLLCVFPFFLFLIRLLDLLNLERWIKNLFILFTGLFLYPVGSGSSTDFIALTCILAGFYYLLRFMNNNGQATRLLFFASLAFFLAALFRYNYIPVSFCCCILLVVAGYFNRNKTWTRGGWKLALFSGPLLFLLLAFQHFYTGSATYINTPATGFYPENILKMYPLALSSITDVQTFLSFISNHTGNYDVYGNILFYTSHIISIALFIYALFYLVRQKKLVLKNKEDHFLYTGLGISICITALLIYFSIRNSAYFSASSRWTYVEEQRYYIFIVVFIQLCVFVFLFNRFTLLSLFWKRVTYICIILMILGSAHKIFYVGKTLIASGPSFAISNPYKRIAVPVTGMFEEIKNKYPEHAIIVASRDNDICNYARLEKIRVLPAIPPAGFVQPGSLPRPIKFIVVIPKPVVAQGSLPAYLSAHYYSQTQNHYFYILDASLSER
ncbi:MAG TPA: hypothetical protein VGO58_07445 [Chitinophagaceae bacterium]|jgi:hypothetical protein|nr:hypothetical protein [Chitinophagaceae bacterium]